eukprot:TRINITY_DN1845_c0_g2_i1.p1 TRINITY_DN1845_c0_g2~~TRINITY_DN1845_c0_g2_i1.p1  ORF type:complete len:291 (+),score=56.54 TRINITY_DN1845_c0_g2_i1:66-938(+)
MCIRDRHKIQQITRRMLLDKKLILLALGICTVLSSALQMNCTDDANVLLTSLRQESTMAIYEKAAMFNSLISRVLDESCMGPKHVDYCNTTLGSIRLLKNETFQKSTSTFSEFAILYNPLKINLFNWTEACVLGSYPNPTYSPHIASGTPSCRSRVDVLVYNLSEIRFGGWYPSTADSINKVLLDLSSDRECFVQSPECMNTLYFTQVFYSNAQNASLFWEWNRNIFQYRENAVNHINVCYKKEDISPSFAQDRSSCSAAGKELRLVLQSNSTYEVYTNSSYINSLIKTL